MMSDDGGDTRVLRRRRVTARIHRRHEARPDGRGQCATRHAGCDRPRLVEAQPYPRHQIGRVADEPDIGIVVGRARLARDDELGRKERTRSTCRAAIDDIVHHVADNEGHIGIESRLRRDHGC